MPINNEEFMKKFTRGEFFKIKFIKKTPKALAVEF